MKRSDLRARIAGIIDDESLVFFEAAEINASIDEASEVIAENSQDIRRTAYCPIREGCNFYFINSIATDIMYPYRIWNHSRDSRLVPASIIELDYHNPTWLNTSGDPDRWFPLSWDFFGIYPHAATSGGVLRVDYIAWPRALMDDDDEPELPESSSPAIEAYGGTEGFLRQWDAAAAAEWWQLFLRENGANKAKTGVRRVQAREYQREH